MTMTRLENELVSNRHTSGKRTCQKTIRKEPVVIVN